MSSGKRHNKIQLFTTISIYVGLVLVGGAPEILAGSKLSTQLTGASFELSARSEQISSKAKYRKQVRDDKIVPHDFPGSTVFDEVGSRANNQYLACDKARISFGFESQKILTTPLLPRASL